MDGHFVNNITFGPKFIADIRKSTRLPLDVHLMIYNPERYIDRFIDAGADYLTIHVEATDKAYEILERIKARKTKCGAVISPDTPVSALGGIIKLCDIALIMSVYPGFGGQSFIENSLNKLKELSKLAKTENPDCLIEIDGGVTEQNAPSIKSAGAQVLVAGNAVFSAQDPKSVIERLRENRIL
jgi:ribulose-phosphate 3-epimerase